MGSGAWGTTSSLFFGGGEGVEISVRHASDNGVREAN